MPDGSTQTVPLPAVGSPAGHGARDWLVASSGQQADRQGQPLQGATETLRRRINLSEAPEVQLDLIDQYFADEEQVPDTCEEPGRLPQ